MGVCSPSIAGTPKVVSTAKTATPRDAVALLLGEINDKDEDCIVEEPEVAGDKDNDTANA